MTFYATAGSASPVVIAREVEVQNSFIGIYTQTPTGAETATEIYVADNEVFSCETQLRSASPAEEFDWSDRRTVREFIRLEQKFLAKRASQEESVRYRHMKQNRNSRIFAERAFRDYEEVRRLKHLAQKLSEIQKYLRPIKI